MVDIFGVTGDDTDNPLMEMYGLESRQDCERDLKDFEDIHTSVVNPTKFTQEKVWGYDADGRPIPSRKLWLEQKLCGKKDVGPADSPLKKKQIEYLFSQRVYSTDGFLDEFGTFGVKSLLERFKYKKENKLSERRGKKRDSKLKEPEIVVKEQEAGSGKTYGQEKHVGWQVSRRAANMEARNKLLKDFEGVRDLSGVIHAMNMNDPNKQRKDAERVFWDYFSRKNQKRCEKRNRLFSLTTPKPDVSLDFSFFPSKKTLFGWREVLFDQAMENIGKYDQRASCKHDTLLGSDQIKGIPPSRIIADMSSEAIRRPGTHHMFQNPIKGFKNFFFKRLEKKYKEYVADVLQLRAEDKAYNELMDLSNRYEARQDWLSQFESSWVFIPQGQAIPDNMVNEANKDGVDTNDVNEYEKELLSLELEAIPLSDMEIFMSQHLKGDILFPDESEAEEAKEAMFRKIVRETAEYNENQPYKLPHRPRASKILPVNDGYNPAEALRKKEDLTRKTKIVKQGRVVANPIEKRKIKALEKGEMKKIEAISDQEKSRKNLQRATSQGLKISSSSQEKTTQLDQNTLRPMAGSASSEAVFKSGFSHGFRNYKMGASGYHLPSTTGGAPSVSKAPPYKRNPMHKTAFDDYLNQNDT